MHFPSAPLFSELKSGLPCFLISLYERERACIVYAGTLAHLILSVNKLSWIIPGIWRFWFLKNAINLTHIWNLTILSNLTILFSWHFFVRCLQFFFVHSMNRYITMCTCIPHKAVRYLLLVVSVFASTCNGFSTIRAR